MTTASVRRGFPIEKIDTSLNADTVEWCPHLNFQQFLICGTYKLKESNCAATVEEQTENKQAQVRDGGVLVYSLEHNSSGHQLQAFASHPMCGVLDVKWPTSLCEDKPIFGLVNAEGAVQLLFLNTSTKNVSLVAEEKLTESSLGLSLDWAWDSTNGQLAASDSSGNLTVFKVGDQLTQLDTWKAHDYEAWITAFHHTNSNILYSGGDDCKMKRWDLRDTSKPTMTSRRHQMGVCSIQSHPIKENIFASGSYDEELLIWDDRQMRSPLLTSTNLGGGIWRIKWEPEKGNHILTATMYNGTHIVQAQDFGVDPLPIVGVYTDHNLAYGADWCRRRHKTHSDSDIAGPNCQDSSKVHSDKCSDSTESYLIATCSFYDHALHLWTWDVN